MLAGNRLALSFWPTPRPCPETERNLSRSIILDWCARRLFRDRPTIASEAAGVQHADVVRHPNDAQANHPSENSQSTANTSTDVGRTPGRGGIRRARQFQTRTGDR